MTKRARTERREAARAAEKIARQREKLAVLEPGGAPERPIDVATAAVIEPQARSMPCLRCGAEGVARIEEHEARAIEDRRLRLVRLACGRCGAARVVYFRIVQPS
jgi:hypothetical protein